MTEKRRVVVLGSSGSIGRQTLDVIRMHPGRFQVVGLCVGSDRDTLVKQANEFGVTTVGVGEADAVMLAGLDEADIVLNAIVGAAGLRASLATLEAGKTLALANKESLVAGGELCLDAAARGGGRVSAVDSEHAAIAQCLEGRDLATVESITLTASGGPFRTRRDLSSVTVEEALQHPTWSMGKKITIDSATMMNKGLEVIEAHFLFGFGYDQINVVVHPQSIVHGWVTFRDGSVVQQAGPADMRIPIQAALTSPERFESPAERLDLAKAGTFEFEEMDHDRFPAVNLARHAAEMGATYPAVLNASNEVAVGAFLEGRLAFTDIIRVIIESIEAHEPGDARSLDDVLGADTWARNEAARRIEAVTGA